jgi:hypothetical protein
MRTITILWESEPGASVRISNIKSSWKPGEDVADLLYAAMRADHDRRVGGRRADVLSVIGAGEARMLAVFEGWIRPLHLHEDETSW